MQQQIDPAIYDEILGYGQKVGDADQQIAYQKMMAENLRKNGQMPGLIDSGRRMVAPHPMAYLGAMANQAVAGSRDQQAMGLAQQQAALRQLQVQKVLDAMKQSQGQRVGSGPNDTSYMPDGSTPQSGV